MAHRRGVALGVFIYLLLGMPLLVACGTQPRVGATADEPTLSTVGSARSENSGAGSYNTAKSLDDLVRQSSVIVVATLSAVGETVNLARDPNDPARPDPEFFSLGQVYQVEVQRYMKGNGSTALKAVQAEGFMPNPPATMAAADIERLKRGYKYIPLHGSTTYLLFLRPLGGFPAATGYLTGPAQPWRFTLSTAGNAQAESPWAGADQAFPVWSSASLLSQVEQLVQATK